MAEKSHYDDVYGLYHSVFADVQSDQHQTVSSTPRQKARIPGEARRGSVANATGQNNLRKAVAKGSTTKMSTAPPGSKFLNPAK